MFFLLCGPILWNIPIGSVTVFQTDISRTLMAIPKFLVFEARWNNARVVYFPGLSHEIFVFMLRSFE